MVFKMAKILQNKLCFALIFSFSYVYYDSIPCLPSVFARAPLSASLLFNTDTHMQILPRAAKDDKTMDCVI